MRWRGLLNRLSKTSVGTSVVTMRCANERHGGVMDQAELLASGIVPVTAVHAGTISVAQLEAAGFVLDYPRTQWINFEVAYPTNRMILTAIQHLAAKVAQMSETVSQEIANIKAGVEAIAADLTTIAAEIATLKASPSLSIEDAAALQAIEAAVAGVKTTADAMAAPAAAPVVAAPVVEPPAAA